jgi:hypothetical protein
MPYDLLGHSAGGQFVGRLTGFVETGARRHVASNAGAYVFPTRDLPFPYGFGGLADELSNDDAIRHYLARPLTIYLGKEDTLRDENLDTSPPAERQGRTRLERGRNVFKAAQELAERKGWACRWRLVEVTGVGHDHRAMFDSPECAEALFDLEARQRSP